MITKYYIFYDSELPKHGWFQACIGCDQVTSKLSLYKKMYSIRTNEEVEIYSYLCIPCKNNLKNAVFLERYIQDCNNYIKDQLSQTLRLHETFV